MREKVVGWLKDRVFDWGKDQIAAMKSEQEIREALDAFIEREAKVNDLCDIAEEIDFEGVCEYVQSDEFREDIKRRLLSGNKKERGVARETIEKKAYAYAGAHTDMARKRVSRFVSLATDILRSFYEKEIGKGDLLSIMLVQDHITEEADNIVERICERIARESSESSVYTPEEFLSLAESGSIDEMSKRVDDLIQVASTKHPLFPDYGYKITNEYGAAQFISRPLSEEALRKYIWQFG